MESVQYEVFRKLHADADVKYPKGSKTGTFTETIVVEPQHVCNPFCEVHIALYVFGLIRIARITKDAKLKEHAREMKDALKKYLPGKRRNLLGLF
jgi:hypothetical protein